MLLLSSSEQSSITPGDMAILSSACSHSKSGTSRGAMLVFKKDQCGCEHNSTSSSISRMAWLALACFSSGHFAMTSRKSPWWAGTPTLRLCNPHACWTVILWLGSMSLCGAGRNAPHFSKVDEPPQCQCAVHVCMHVLASDVHRDRWGATNNDGRMCNGISPNTTPLTILLAMFMLLCSAKMLVARRVWLLELLIRVI